MGLIATFRTMDKRLRIMIVSTALLVVPQIGQFMAIADINKDGHESGLAFFFMFAGIFIVPTGVILSVAVLMTEKGKWKKFEPIVLLAFLNIILAISLTWFFIHPCSWAQVFGIPLASCR